MTFNLTATLDCARKTPEVYASVVLPRMTDEEIALVEAALADERVAAGRKALSRQLPGAPDDVLDAYAEHANALDEILSTYGVHKDSAAEGGWAGYSVRAFHTEHGSIKVTLTDPK